MNTPPLAAVLLAFAMSVFPSFSAEKLSSRSSHFIGITDFSRFTQTTGDNSGETVLTSPEIEASIDWDNLVLSWNVKPAACVQVQARAIGPDWASRFYDLGHWSLDPVRFRRTSIKGQCDADGDVKTDEVVLKRPARCIQLRLTLSTLDGSPAASAVKFLGASFLNTTATNAPAPPNKAAWGRTIPVPERGQLDYPDGRDWCSPTCVSMMLTHWANVFQRPELNVDVPKAARQIHDPNWPGTGNWPFNTAFAGSFASIRAYVTRFENLSEVESWIATDLPVVLSVSFDLLNGKAQNQGTGHLVICAGFTESGDVVVNDPWAPKKDGLRVRRVFPRQQVVKAWAHSSNTVYLIYPESMKTPPNLAGHW